MKQTAFLRLLGAYSLGEIKFSLRVLTRADDVLVDKFTAVSSYSLPVGSSSRLTLELLSPSRRGKLFQKAINQNRSDFTTLNVYLASKNLHNL